MFCQINVYVLHIIKFKKIVTNSYILLSLTWSACQEISSVFKGRISLLLNFIYLYIK